MSGLSDLHWLDTLVRLFLLMTQEAVWSGTDPRPLCVLVRRLTQELEQSQAMWTGWERIRNPGVCVCGGGDKSSFFSPLVLHAWHVST